VNLRLSGRLAGRELRLTPLEATGPAVAAPKDKRPAFSARHGRMIQFAVYDRSGLRPGMTLTGPAIIEEASATTVVDADGRVEIDPYGSLGMEREREDRRCPTAGRRFHWTLHGPASSPSPMRWRRRSFARRSRTTSSKCTTCRPASTTIAATS